MAGGPGITDPSSPHFLLHITVRRNCLSFLLLVVPQGAEWLESGLGPSGPF